MLDITKHNENCDPVEYHHSNQIKLSSDYDDGTGCSVTFALNNALRTIHYHWIEEEVSMLKRAFDIVKSEIY